MPTAKKFDTEFDTRFDMSNVRQMTYPGSPQSTKNEISREEVIKIVRGIVNDPDWLKWMKMRYSSKSHASFCFKTAKQYLVDVLMNPALLKQLNYRRARGVIEAIAPLRDYAKIRYGVELKIDTEFLWKFMPHKSVSKVTEAILEYELKDENRRIEIVNQALEGLKRVLQRNTKYRLPVLVAFFTGLRAPEIKYMFDKWSNLKKIKVIDGVVLVILNYDRKKKKCYFTLMPERLVELINKHHKEVKLTNEWRSHVLHKFGVAVGIFRKSWVAITVKYLDKNERYALQGRAKEIEIEHYIKHITDISRRYLEAFKQYIHLIHLISKGE